MDYSIVVFIYNPDERILKRCLEAIHKLDRTGISTEVLIVDNNSTVPVVELLYVQEYLQRIPFSRTILVKEQGLQYARIAGIEQSIGKHIVFFDYDNEPHSDYLQVLKLLNEKFTNVAAWGPGNVWVDFIDGVDAGIEAYARGAFQERHDSAVRYASETEWQSSYPFGTGLCTYAFLLKEYAALARSGHLTSMGRKGNKLSSGDDTQMVLLCIKKGYAAGVAPELKINHIIPGSRANSQYLVKLIYGAFVCYETCSLQLFPEKLASLQKKMMPPGRFSRKAIKKFFKVKRKANPNRLFDFVQFIAQEVGIYEALGKPVPWIVRKILKHINAG